MEPRCFTCNGTGKMPCTICGGRGHTSRLNYRREVEITPCIPTMTCSSCGGRGTLGTGGIGWTEALPVPDAEEPEPSDDPLAGRWITSGGHYVFARDGAGYTYAEIGALGKIGEGRAVLSGADVVLEGTNALLGAMRLVLRLEGDTLRGTLRFMGIPMPLVLHRR